MTEAEKCPQKPVSARAAGGDVPAALPPEPEKSSRRIETGMLAGGSMVLFLAVITVFMAFDMYRRLQANGKTYTVTETVPVPALPGLAPNAVSADTAAYAAGSALQGVLLGDLPLDTRDGSSVGTAARARPSAGGGSAKTDGKAAAAASLAELNAIMLRYKDKPGVAELVAVLKKQGVDITAGGLDPKALAACSAPEFKKAIDEIVKKPAAQATLLTLLADPAVKALFTRSKAAAGGAKTSPLDMISGGSRKGGGSASSQLGIVADPQFAGVAAPTRAGALSELSRSAPAEKASSGVKIE